MNVLKEAQTAVNFASYYPILHKATADNSTPCPGYIFEEVVRLSFLSHSHCTHLLGFMLTRLKVSTEVGQQKVINVLRHLVERGSANFRCLLRDKDQVLRDIRGHGENDFSSGINKTPQLMLMSSVQQLLTDLFNEDLIRSDEQKRNSTSEEQQGGNMTGMGVSSGSNSSKYQGFGSSAVKESPLNMVRGLMDRVLWPNVKEPSAVSKAILTPDLGNYIPFQIPDEHLNEIAPYLTNSRNILATSDGMVSSMHGFGGSGMNSVSDFLVPIGKSSPVLRISPISESLNSQRDYSSIATTRAHAVGRAGGGWDEEEDLLDNAPTPIPTGDINPSCSREKNSLAEMISSMTSIHIKPECPAVEPAENLGTQITVTENTKEDQFIADFLSSVKSWPVPYAELSEKCEQCSSLNPMVLLENIGSVLKKEDTSYAQLMALLMLIDNCAHDDIFKPMQLYSAVLPSLNFLSENRVVNDIVKVRAKRIASVTDKLAILCQ